ncbi:MAG: hypothetical protein QXZ44_05790, partial [Ferroplasma sp.]
MEAKQFYDIKFASDIHVSGQYAYFTLKYIKNDEYHSVIKVLNRNGEMKQVTFGENERSPKIFDNKLYYVKYGKDSENLFVVENLSEEKLVASFSKIADYTVINGNVYVIATEASDNKLPFVTSDIKYRFNGRGLIRQFSALYLIGDAIKKIYGGHFDVAGIAHNSKKIVISTTENSNDYGLADL